MAIYFCMKVQATRNKTSNHQGKLYIQYGINGITGNKINRIGRIKPRYVHIRYSF